MDKYLKIGSNCSLKLGPIVFRLSLRVKFIGSNVFDANEKSIEIESYLLTFAYLTVSVFSTEFLVILILTSMSYHLSMGL